MMVYNSAYLQHSMGDHGRHIMRRMVQAQAHAVMTVDNSIRPHDIEQEEEEEETMEEHLDKCNREWAHHYVVYMYSHSLCMWRNKT
jgi:hypothetical protein